MDELYAILEQALCVEYKVQSLKNVLELIGKKENDAYRTDMQSVVSVVIDSLECIDAKQNSNISELDSYIAKNASKVRKIGNEIKTAQT